MTWDKRKLLFIVVLVLFAMILFYRFQNPYVQEEVDQLTYGRGSDTSAEKLKSKVGVVKTGAQKKALDFSGRVTVFFEKKEVKSVVQRDLFSIYSPPVKRKKVNTVKIRPQKKEDSVTESENKANLIRNAREYLTSYRMYGSYKNNGTKAIFLGRDKQVLVARVGDRLDGKYLVDDIENNKIRIKALDLNETIHLDMQEFKDD